MSSCLLVKRKVFEMYVLKRDGRRERVHFDKITSRIEKLAWGLNKNVEPIVVTQKVNIFVERENIIYILYMVCLVWFRCAQVCIRE